MRCSPVMALADACYDGFSAKICSNAEHKVNALLARIDGIPFGGPYLSNRKFVKVIKSSNPMWCMCIVSILLLSTYTIC